VATGDLLRRAQEEGNPLIEGSRITFVWQGESAPELISDLGGWECKPRPFLRYGRDSWIMQMALDNDAYLEYAFLDPVTKERLPDPLNRRRVYNGLGKFNHYFYMPGAEPTPYAKTGKEGLRGKLTRHLVDGSKAFTIHKQRRVYLYDPPAETAVPLLVVYDGLDYARRGKLAQIVDNLIADRLIEPIAIAFVQNGGKQGRMVEYACSEATVWFVEQLIYPYAAGKLNLIDHQKQPGAHGIMGASMGGLMAMFTALRKPELFGRALGPGGAYAPPAGDSLVMDLVRWLPPPEVKLWLDCGRMDPLLSGNRRLAILLKQRGYKVGYRENGGGHNYTTWRNACAEGLKFIFPSSRSQ
jgi:enterochelin esterase family protein